MKAQLMKSSRKDKKYMVKMDGKTIHFGAAGMDDFTITGDEEQKKRYMARHQKENWNDSKTAGFWAKLVLWNKKTIRESLRDIQRRFGISVELNAL